MLFAGELSAQRVPVGLWIGLRIFAFPGGAAPSESAAPSGGRLRLRLDNDGSSREVDHALLGTGYRVDVTRYPFLPSELSAGLAQVNGFPKLTAGFESSIAGLHFMGAPSSWNFGPLMFFVCGTDYGARRGWPATSPPVHRATGLREPLWPFIVKGLVLNNTQGRREPSGNRAGAVIVGGDFHGLGIIRSLGRRGVPLCVVDDEYSIGRFFKIYDLYCAGSESPQGTGGGRFPYGDGTQD